MVAEYQKAILDAARRLEPHLLFAFKATFLKAETIDAVRARGAVAINVYPDLGFTIDGPYLARALPRYDWIFTTKSHGLRDLERILGVRNASFMPHVYDPEVHAPIELDDEDRARYACDASFIGTWTPKKEALLAYLAEALPDLKLKVWGNQWERARAPALAPVIMGDAVTGKEYAKAIRASLISIAILREARGEAALGDLSTTRTFEIPAARGFMLHERNAEVQGLFEEGRECAMFEGADELVEKMRYWLARSNERRLISMAGLERCLRSGYSVDHASTVVINKGMELRRVLKNAEQ
jgi:spore maturation protein CgeB